MPKKTTTRKKTPKRKTIKDERPDVMMYDPPIGLGQVVGHERPIGVLQQSMRSDRLHHAWIFHGPEGIGKFTTAISWAAMMLDPTTAPDLGGNLAHDEDSGTQHLIRSGTHPDLFVIRKELTPFASDPRVRNQKQRTIPKAIIDEYLVQPAALAPTHRERSLAGKVFIVDEAELIGHDGQNAMLKTLEEPGPGTIIILVTSSEDRLLPTIRSRCQRVGFLPLADDAMRHWIKELRFDLDPAAHHWYMQHAEGAPGRFRTGVESDLYGWHTQIDPMLSRAMRGEHPAGLGALMSSLVDDWAAKWVKAGDKLGQNRSKEAANHKGAAMMLSLVAQRAQSGLSNERNRDSALQAIDSVSRANDALHTNVSLKMVMEYLVAGISDRRR